MSKNGMATYDGVANYVNLTHLPTPKKEYTVNFEKLTGGLNLYAPDYRLKTNESPDMENMLWKNGTLCSRYGQSWAENSGSRTVGYACFSELFYDKIFFHAGRTLYYYDPETKVAQALFGLDNPNANRYHGPDTYADHVQRGTFARYREYLVYKAPGIFVGVYPNSAATYGFSLRDFGAESSAYTPVTYINANWQNGSGDKYQPENRLSSKKTVWYNAGTEEKTQTFTGDGSRTDFTITQAGFAYITDVTVNGLSVGNWDVSGTTLHFYDSPNTWTVENGDLHVISAPPADAVIVVTMQCAVKTYYLPVKDNNTTISSIKVDGSTTTAYTFNAAQGLVTFTTAPTVTQPATNNTVQITYSLANDDAYNSVMDCRYLAVYGGNQDICMVVGGCSVQPNAFFWNGNDNVSMNPSYWPMEQFNLGGDTEDAITGFGRQQGHLVVFKNRSVGKVSMDFTTVDSNSETTARTYIEMDYTQINSKIGCDLPWSIQLIDNNLVFCNSQQGVHYIKDSSAAYENNIVQISTKVNGDNGRVGLLQRIRDASIVSSFDDERRYWLIADDKVYCWDYDISDANDPSWFYLSGIDGSTMCKVAETVYELTNIGRIAVFDNSYADFDEGFERRYQFATQYFGSYDRLKTVTRAIYTFRADTDFRIKVTYKNDYEVRDDLTSIDHVGWRLVPRNLRYYSLSVEPFAHVAVRKPGCRHVRHFATVLTCTGVGFDMPILSAQVMYKFEGRDR